MNQSLLLTYHVRCSACWHTLLLHRGGVSACYSWFPLCARSRLPWSYIPQYIPSSSTKCSQSPQQPYATTMWRVSFYAAPPTPQHAKKNRESSFNESLYNTTAKDKSLAEELHLRGVVSIVLSPMPAKLHIISENKMKFGQKHLKSCDLRCFFVILHPRKEFTRVRFGRRE